MVVVGADVSVLDDVVVVLVVVTVLIGFFVLVTVFFKLVFCVGGGEVLVDG